MMNMIGIVIDNDNHHKDDTESNHSDGDENSENGDD